MNERIFTARDVAVLALQDRAGNVTAHLERLLARGGMSAEDKSLARELALGVVRRQGTLRAVLRAFLQHPEKRLPSPLEEILLVAAYQLLFLERIPEFAAVNEAVEQAARLHHRRQSGLVNGVLRTITREIKPLESGSPAMAPDVIPIGPNAWRKASKRIFSDPSASPAEYLSAAHSLPAELAERWIARLGLKQAAALAAQANVRAPFILRVNRLKAGLEEAADLLAADGAAAVRHENGVSLVLAGHANVTELAAFRQGFVQPQDATATAVGLAAAPRAGMRVLDFCAAPGTKTTHLAELMDNRGEIVAVDVLPEKLEKIESNCRRLGVTIVRTMPAEQVGGLEPGSFDLVLADVPCSNAGVLARRAEARWQFTPERLAGLVKDQQFLAAAAAQFVKPGGRLVYSTCSIEPEEDQEIVRRLLERRRDLTLLREQLSLPGGAEGLAGWHDGGYYAILQAR